MKRFVGRGRGRLAGTVLAAMVLAAMVLAWTGCEGAPPPTPRTEPGQLGAGHFATPCAQQAPTVCMSYGCDTYGCGSGFWPLAVGAAPTVEFQPGPGVAAGRVEPVSAKVLAQPFQSAFVALIADRVVDFTNLESMEIDWVALESLRLPRPPGWFDNWWDDDDEPTPEWVDERFPVGCPGPPEWDVEQVFLVPLAGDRSSRPLMGIPAWDVRVEPEVASAVLDGNRVALSARSDLGEDTDADLVVTLPGTDVRRAFPLRACAQVHGPDASDAPDVPDAPDAVDAADAPDAADGPDPPDALDAVDAPDADDPGIDAPDADTPDADAFDAPADVPDDGGASPDDGADGGAP